MIFAADGSFLTRNIEKFSIFTKNQALDLFDFNNAKGYNLIKTAIMIIGAYPFNGMPATEKFRKRRDK